MEETITEKLMRAAVEAWGQWPWVPGTVVKEMTGLEDGERTISQLAVLLGCDWEQAGRLKTSLFAVTKAVFDRSPRVCDTCAHGFIGCGLGHETGGIGCDDWSIASRPWQDVPGARRRWADKDSDPVPIPPMMPVGELLERARAWLASRPVAKQSISLDPEYMAGRAEAAREGRR